MYRGGGPHHWYFSTCWLHLNLRYWSVWVGFLYTVVFMFSSAFTWTQVPRNGSLPSPFCSWVSLTCGLMLFMYWMKLSVLVQFGESVFHVLVPDVRWAFVLIAVLFLTVCNTYLLSANLVSEVISISRGENMFFLRWDRECRRGAIKHFSIQKILICSQWTGAIKFLPDFLHGIFHLDFHLILTVFALVVSYFNLDATQCAIPIHSYKYQLQQMGSHKCTTACTPSLVRFFIGELAVSLFLVAGNVCTSHFLVGNDLELFSRIAPLNGEIFIKRRVPLWRGENFSVGGSFWNVCQLVFVQSDGVIGVWGPQMLSKQCWGNK